MRPAWYPRVHAPRVTWTCPREALARACGVAEFGASLQCFVHRYYEEPPRFETFDERAAYEQASGNVDMCEKLEMILVHPEHGKRRWETIRAQMRASNAQLVPDLCRLADVLILLPYYPAGR